MLPGYSPPASLLSEGERDERRERLNWNDIHYPLSRVRPGYRRCEIGAKNTLLRSKESRSKKHLPPFWREGRGGAPPPHSARLLWRSYLLCHAFRRLF